VNARSDTVLVTGAAGFAGSHLVEHLSGRGNLIAWTRSPVPPALSSLATWRTVDLLDRDAVRREIRDLRPGSIYHLAGAPSVARSWDNTAGTLASNVLTTHYVLDAVRRAGVAARALVVSSAQIYAASDTPLREDSPLAPASPYALSKLAQEQVGRQTFTEDGIDVILVRPFNHTGPRQAPAFAAPGMAKQIAAGEAAGTELRVRVGNLDAQRDLTDVRDIVRAYALLMERGKPGIEYNVASGVARPIRAVLDGLIARAKVTVSAELDPERLRPNDTPIMVGDATRLREATGWAPEVSFDQMLSDLLDYWRSEIRRGR
jgi:GDP-4-dehydro-6-deoxy-D-mannose reductase